MVDTLIDIEELQAAQRAARAETGWAFDGSDSHGVKPLPWDYRAIVSDFLKNAGSVLELGTGGGEVFGETVDGFEGKALATEEWEVNAPVARDHLASYGVPVVQCSSLELPVRNGAFDLIVSRHEAIEPHEINRVLTDGGYFVTQQVVHDNWREVHEFFPRATKYPDHFKSYREDFEAQGFLIERAENHYYQAHFPSLAALVYMLTRDIWTIPKFNVEADLDALNAMAGHLDDGNGFRMTEGRYILIAKKPGEAKH